MRLDLLAQVLEVAGLGTRGESIFIHRFAAETVQGVMLRTPLDGVPVDTNLPNYFHHQIQVIVRAADYVVGETLAKAVQKALTIYNRKFYDGNTLLMQVNHIIPKTLPRVYPTLDSRGSEWSLDMDTNYVMPL